MPQKRFSGNSPPQALFYPFAFYPVGRAAIPQYHRPRRPPLKLGDGPMKTGDTLHIETARFIESSTMDDYVRLDTPCLGVERYLYYEELSFLPSPLNSDFSAGGPGWWRNLPDGGDGENRF